MSSIRERWLKIISQPIISEKSTDVADSYGQFVFKVRPDATKLEIKNAIEYVFNVNVVKVSTLNMKGKTKRAALGKLGKRKDWKKAYVTLEKGQDIDFIIND